MPLIKSKSKKAFEKNVETEMKSNPDPKDKAQNLAIAYSVKRKAAAKKYAQGGNVSASNEKRSMPDDSFNDSKSVGKNSGNKPPYQDQWTDSPTVRQAQKPSITALSQPKIVGGDTFSVRNRTQRDENNNQIDSFYPESSAQPRQRYNEDGPNRQGPESRDLNLKMMANGGAIKYTDKPDTGYGKIIFKAEGGEIEHPDSIAAAIMAKKAYMKNGRYEHPEDEMLKEGEVDIDDNGKEIPNAYYSRDREVLDNDIDSDMEGVSQPKDSNRHGDEIDSDIHDMVSKIRAKMSAKRMFR